MGTLSPIGIPSMSTLVDLLRFRSETSPRTAYTFLRDRDGSEISCTYQELDLQAKKIAAWLRSEKFSGERVLLVYPQGLDYIAAFLGCLYAGSVAVPVYPPRLNRHFHRIATAIKDCCPSVALTSRALLSEAESAGEAEPELRLLRWCAVEDMDPDLAARWIPPSIDERSIAFLQYTSGSTAQPKGVIITHGNLICNQKMIQHAFGVTEESVILGWLPLFHDMGLIGNVLQALWTGARCILLSPERFLRRPFNWLNAISTYHATISGGPNFAYDWCSAKITEEERAALNLHSWSIAFNGSEPIRASTMAAFSRRFSNCGFDLKAFFPCYGLAEATLFVSGKTGDAPLTVAVSSVSLERNEFKISNEGGEQTRVVVSSGTAGIDEEIAIVDADTLLPCAPGKIGEIWVAGENVARGYWNQPEASKVAFNAYTAQNRGPYLRTGDLGYLLDGELFITGRAKDLIIVRGRNHYPQDLEFTVARSHPAFAGGAGAAFTIELEGAQQPVLVQEVPANSKSHNLEQLLQTAVQAIVEEHEIQMHAVALVQASSLPKTSSGKIRRQECRRQFLNSELRVLLARTAGAEVPSHDSAVADVPDQARTFLEKALLEMAAEILKLPALDIDTRIPLTAYGLDSLQVAELNHRMAKNWNVELPLEELLELPTITKLAALLEDKLRHVTKEPAAEVKRSNHLEEWPLSFGQLAIVYLYRLAPQVAAYHIPVAVRIRGPLDHGALQSAMDELVRRHECLHSVFVNGESGMVQRLAAGAALPFRSEDAEGCTDQQLQARLSPDVSIAFDLERGPLFRVALFRRSAEEHVLLLVFHHIITDLASLTLLFEELRRLYADRRQNRRSDLPRWPYRYADFVLWQQEMLQGKRGEELKEYWKQQLRDGLPILKLPADHPRPATQTYRGAMLNFRIDKAVASQVHQLARAQTASTYTVVLAAFAIFLQRYTSQHDIVLGSPVSGRTRSYWSGLPGYLINQIVYRIQLSGEQTSRNLLMQVREMVAGGLAHQDYPLALLAEDLQPDRDPAYPAMFQVMFSFQRSVSSQDENVVTLALNEPGVPVDFDNTKMESFPLKHDTAQLDLTLTMAQFGEEFIASFQYNADLFEHSTVERMADHFRTLVQSLISSPESHVDELQLMSPAERQRLIFDWNATGQAYSSESRIHDLFSGRALAQGDCLAVIGGGEQMTYLQLEQKSNQLARHLAVNGAGAGQVIGLCMDRCASLLAGMLGILKTGAAYLPLDPLLPDERISYMMEDAGVKTVIVQQALANRLKAFGAKVICLDENESIATKSTECLEWQGSSDHLAYVMYTSGSTGKPKGVMITHRGVVNFFHAMDGRISCTPRDTLLATTAISFDISVLELLWTLTCGAKVVLADPLALSPRPVPVRSAVQELDYSLFYFASADEQQAENKYELLMEGAKYADQNGFTAVWTPERHFHPFGGLYPNPAVTGAALAAITRKVQIRAGSVVLPLHNVIRVAEEWSVVDNLSGGRTGLAFASGWHADDFVFVPQNYSNRKELMFQSIETFLNLWRGEAVRVQSGSGKEIEVRIFPKPQQERPPLWITAAGTPDTFVRAGQIGANVLTHLLGQGVEDVEEKIKLYRESRKKHGHDPDAGKVSLMLHTFLADDREKVKEHVREPFTKYLMSSVDLIRNLAKSANLPLKFESMSPKDMEDLLTFAFERYFETSALFGTVKSCQPMIEKLRDIGVNEIACLIDFGIEKHAALKGLSYVTDLKRSFTQPTFRATRSVAELAKMYRPTMLQCTPAVMKIVSAGQDGLAALRSLHTLMLGGESLPPALAREIKDNLGCRLVNMYGPTETTVWSSTAEIASAASAIHVGTPIANTTMYILDRNSGLPAPTGVVGELCIGGHGVARGYLNRPDLTAEKFMPDPFSSVPGQRIYRTGDVARYLPHGNIELLGRNDNQIKIRGVRIELGEIEAALCEHAAVAQAVVVAHKEGGDERLAAYIVSAPGQRPAISELRSFLKAKLQEAMVPSIYMFMPGLPLTASGKIDRRLLPQPKAERQETGVSFVAPATEYEMAITAIWKLVLNMDRIGIDDNFFDLGGHSLRLVQVHGELVQSFGRDVPLVRLLEHPTIRALAAYLMTGAEGKDEPIQPTGNRAMNQQAAMLRQRQKSMTARRSAQSG